MRCLLAVLVVVSTMLAGCHGAAPDMEDQHNAITTEWSGDTASGMRCRLVQPAGPMAVGEESPVRVEYELVDPGRFDSVEAELGDGLARVGGLLRETGPLDGNETVEVTLQPLDEGAYVVQAYVVWDDGRAERCGAFDLDVADA